MLRTKALPAVKLSVLGWLASMPAPERISAQQAVPIITVSAPAATSSQKFGGILGIREIADGKLLVDDAGNRRLLVLDAALAIQRVVLDSAIGTNAYGRRPAPIIPYLGDSTLFPDYQSVARLVLDGQGNIVRSLALPRSSDIGVIRRGAAIDHAGRLVFLGDAPALASSTGAATGKKDSMPLLRADFDLRRTDTVGQVSRPLRVTRAMSLDSSTVLSIWTVDALQTQDDWAMLANGSIGIVRGHDYHVNWIRENGTTSSSQKLPFDWKQRIDDDKQRMIDSTRTSLSEAFRDGTIAGRAEMISVAKIGAGSPNGGEARGRAPGLQS